MEHEGNAHLDNFLQNSQNLMENLQMASGGVAGEIGGFVASADFGGISGGKFEEDDEDEWKYIKEVQQSEKQQQTMKVDAAETIVEVVKGVGNGDVVAVGELMLSSGGQHEHDHDQDGNGVAGTNDGGSGSSVDVVADEEVEIIKNDGDFSTNSNTTSTTGDADGDADVLQVEMKIETAVKVGGEELEEEEPSSLATNTTNGTSSLSEQAPKQDFVIVDYNAGLDDKENADPLAEPEVGDSPTRPNDFDFELHSQLNPDAKEFVPSFGSTPSSPTGEIGIGEPASLFNQQEALPTAMARHMLSDMDDFVAASPRKGSGANMDAISLPAKIEEFEHEAAKRPHELEQEGDLIGENNQSVQHLTEQTENNKLSAEPKNTEDCPDFQPASFVDHGPETSVDLDVDIDPEPETIKKSLIEVDNSEPIEQLLNTVQPLPNDSESINNSFTEESGFGAGDKELLHVEEKENISHSPSTEELQMDAQPAFHASSKDIPQMPIDMDSAANMESSFYAEHTSADAQAVLDPPISPENLFDNTNNLLDDFNAQSDIRTEETVVSTSAPLNLLATEFTPASEQSFEEAAYDDEIVHLPTLPSTATIDEDEKHLMDHIKEQQLLPEEASNESGTLRKLEQQMNDLNLTAPHTDGNLSPLEEVAQPAATIAENIFENPFISHDQPPQQWADPTMENEKYLQHHQYEEEQYQQQEEEEDQQQQQQYQLQSEVFHYEQIETNEQSAQQEQEQPQPEQHEQQHEILDEQYHQEAATEPQVDAVTSQEEETIGEHIAASEISAHPVEEAADSPLPTEDENLLKESVSADVPAAELVELAFTKPMEPIATTQAAPEHDEQTTPEHPDQLISEREELNGFSMTPAAEFEEPIATGNILAAFDHVEPIASVTTLAPGHNEPAALSPEPVNEAPLVTADENKEGKIEEVVAAATVAVAAAAVAATAAVKKADADDKKSVAGKTTVLSKPKVGGVSAKKTAEMKKPTTAAPKTATTTGAASRPRTAPAATAKSAFEKKTTTTASAAKPATTAKKPLTSTTSTTTARTLAAKSTTTTSRLTTATASKAAAGAAKTSLISARPSASSTGSGATTARKTLVSSTTTNGAAPKTRPATAPVKPTTLGLSTAASTKAKLSPRATLSSQLRKAGSPGTAATAKSPLKAPTTNGVKSATTSTTAASRTKSVTASTVTTTTTTTTRTFTARPAPKTTHSTTTTTTTRRSTLPATTTTTASKTSSTLKKPATPSKVGGRLSLSPNKSALSGTPLKSKTKEVATKKPAASPASKTSATKQKSMTADKTNGTADVSHTVADLKQVELQLNGNGIEQQIENGSHEIVAAAIENGADALHDLLLGEAQEPHAASAPPAAECSLIDA